jgi:hypothetical protein
MSTYIFVKCEETGKSVQVEVIYKEILSLSVRLPKDERYDGELTMNLYKKNRDSRVYIGRKFGLEFTYAGR